MDWTLCDECGEHFYDADEYSSCYSCFVDRRGNYVDCIFCGRWHSPRFDCCFRCRVLHGRDEAARDLRQYILWRDGYRCQDCGERGFLQVDHIKPCRYGGTAHPWNLQALCGECNRLKSGTWIPGGRWDRRRRELLGAYFYEWRRFLDDDQRQAMCREIDQLRRSTGTGWLIARRAEAARETVRCSFGGREIER